MLCDDQQNNPDNNIEQLKSQLADYQQLFNCSESASLIIDSDGIPLDCNEAYLKLFGLSELSQITPFQFGKVSPEKQADGRNSVEKADENISAAKLNGQHRFEWLHKAFNGREFCSSVVIQCIQYSGKECICISVHDISEQKDVQGEMDIIFRNSLVGLLLVKGGRKLVQCNQRAVDILGYNSPEELKGISMKEFHLTDQSFNDFGNKHYYNLCSGETIQVEYEFKKKDGSPVWCTISGKALDTNNPSDLTKGVLWVFDDISSRKVMEEDILESRNELDSIFKNSQVGLLLLRGGRKIARCNQRFADILGYRSPEELVGVSMRAVHLTEERYIEFGEKYYNNLRQGDLIQVDYQLKKKNGDSIWCTNSGRALDSVDPPDLSKGVLWVVDDLTKRKAMELEVLDAKNRAEEARLEAEKANQYKSDFLANMSHEIRTPINAITGLTYLMQQGELNAQQHDYMQKIESSANALLGVINDILDFSKIEAGKLEIEHVDFDLHAVIKSVSTLVEMKAAEKGLSLIISYGNDVPKILNGDPLRLGQVLTNLANNAVKFTDKGEVRILVSRIEKNRFCFEVRDTGIGLKPDLQKKLFQSFMQANTSTTRKYGGTGLGLAICKQLVNMMDGDIRIESEFGKGSSFIFDVVLEVSEKHEGLIKSEGAVNVVSQGDPGNDLNSLRSRLVTLRGSNILLVEDNALNRKVIQDILAYSGITVHEAHDGKEAVEALRLHPGKFELVLMDIQMPVMDGYEATKLIRQFDRHTPIVALTANALSVDVLKTQDAGMNEHLNKPIDVAKLFSVLLRFISAKDNEPDITLPDFQYIDVAAGLSNIMGDLALYKEILGIFVTDFEGTSDAIGQALKDENYPSAKRLALTMKEVSANIGAMNLNHAAAILEESLEPALLSVFDKELRAVIEEIRLSGFL